MFEQPAGGTVLTTVSMENVSVADGFFTVSLPLEAQHFAADELWLEIAARSPAGTGSFVTLTPRQRFAWTPMAFRALKAGYADSTLWSSITGIPDGFADGVDDGGDGHSLDASDGSPIDAVFVNTNGDVGIGTTGPETRLHVLEGSAGAVTANASSSLVLESSAANFLSILSPDANERGVAFGSPASNVHGGIYYTNAAGMRFRTGGNNTFMVLSPTGELGLGAAPGGATLRVQGAGAMGDIWITPTTAGGDSDVVLTENTAGTFGMTMRHNGTSNLLEFVGINSGTETTPRMTISRASTGGVTIANNLSVGGTLTKGAGTFKIDHPLDPENKYLSHSFVESPDMMNIYKGNVTTDAAGYATIEMPEWFSALNCDFRYQLTVIDDADSEEFVHAKVARRIVNNTFIIRTSRPHTDVSWQITGVRQDAFATQNPIPVEEWKKPDDRGRYLHPGAFGKPDEQRIGASKD